MEWKKALEYVGKLKGWHVTESDGQGAVVDNVFSKVWSHLSRNYMLATDDLVGIDCHVENMKKLLSSDFECVKVIAIHGMGGLGKTTIAKELFNEVHTQFSRHCFLEDVRETLLKPNGILALQEKIISNILHIDVKLLDANEGINIIDERIRKYKALIILDDVDIKVKFNEILGQKDFHPGSRIVITTRDINVMKFFEDYKLYEPEGLANEFSLQLFSKHAFRQDYPPEEDVGLSMKFVEIAAGLPLALKVIGSLLFRESKSFWNAKLIQLKDISPSEVLETLRISYLELTHEEQQVFLDIACHFAGEENEGHFYMWRDCDFHPEIAITTLVQRSLIKINQNYERSLFATGEQESNVFRMHDHLRLLGRTIVREENFQCPWRRSRIWYNKNALEMFTLKEGSTQLEALEVDVLNEEHFELNDRHFEKLSGLRYLKVTGGELAGNFRTILPNMRWLHLLICGSVPIDLDMKNLVIFHLEFCTVTNDWRGWTRIKDAHKLKSISLRYCNMLRTAPDLSECENLEEIFIEDCSSMSGELHIGNLNRLRELHLCRNNITELSGLGQVINLEILKIVDTPSLISLDGLEYLILLKQFRLESCAALNKLPSFSNLTKVQELQISLCEHLPELYGHGRKGEPLSRLLIDGYDKPECSGSMEPLLPFLCNLGNLQGLEFRDTGTNSLLSRERVLDLSGLSNLHDLSMSGCKRFTEVIGFERLASLGTLNLADFTSLRKLSNLSGLKKIKRFGLMGCPQLSEVIGIEEMDSLVTAPVPDCPWSRNLPNMSGLQHFKGFLISGRPALLVAVGEGSSVFVSSSESESESESDSD
ncbi:Disease resistance protein L6 [Linum grandiflorum]